MPANRNDLQGLKVPANRNDPELTNEKPADSELGSTIQPDFGAFSQACVTMAAELAKMPAWHATSKIDELASQLGQVITQQVAQQRQTAELMELLRLQIDKLDTVQRQQQQVLQLIHTKDVQQRARQINYNSMHNPDRLEGLPNDDGDIPPKFPPTRLEFKTMDDVSVSALLSHYNLPLAPSRNRKERLARHIGLRVA